MPSAGPWPKKAHGAAHSKAGIDLPSQRTEKQNYHSVQLQLPCGESVCCSAKKVVMWNWYGFLTISQIWMTNI